MLKPSVLFSCAFLTVVATVRAAAPNSLPVLKIDAGHIVARVSPLHAGLMTEEINHAYDGGLYAELLASRALNEPIDPKPDALAAWSLLKEGSGKGSLGLEVSNPLNDAVPACLRIEASEAAPSNRIGVVNPGYWGIAVKPGSRYRATFYGKAQPGSDGHIVLSLENSTGTVTFARADVTPQPGPWQRYASVLTVPPGTPPTADARFVLSFDHPGSVRVTALSLFPPTYHGRPNGNRIDLMEKLAALHPRFLRFPGGNYLEGDTVATRFDWKKTLGDPMTRPGHAGPWRYWSSDGLGLLEFLEWCEDLGMQPVLGVYAGLSLQERPVPAGEKLQPFVQDALDEIEYITGDVTTPWGARRAQDGHPAPFKLTYVEIGNEDDYGDRETGYDDRFAAFFDALKDKYPALQLIATMPVKSRRPDVLDEHFYRSADQFFDDVAHYDAYDRKGPKIFVGEWATLEGTPTPNLHAALSDAAWMTGMERNSDVVIMQAYAPLLTNVNPAARQWRTNLIGYDALTSYGSPSYYAQAMFNAHRGDAVLASSAAGVSKFFTSVTQDTATGAIYLKAVNGSAAAQTVRIEISGASHIAAIGKQIVLSGQPHDTNSINDPEHLIPVETSLTGVEPAFDHTFPAWSVTVLELHRP